MSTTSTGRRAENVAAAYLVKQGYQIVSQNWRTRWCEIDIVATKGMAVTFIEVKYRKRSHWGEGFDYITLTKERQMSFAAEFWMTVHDWSGQCYLGAVEVSGPKFEVTGFVPEI